MVRMLGVALLALTGALALALPAAAQDEPEGPVGEIIVSSDGQPALPDDVVLVGVRIDLVGPDPGDELTEAELVHYLRRLPTLADLSKERWNETHRRFDGLRGRPARRA